MHVEGSGSSADEYMERLFKDMHEEDDNGSIEDFKRRNLERQQLCLDTMQHRNNKNEKIDKPESNTDAGPLHSTEGGYMKRSSDSQVTPSSSHVPRVDGSMVQESLPSQPYDPKRYIVIDGSNVAMA